MAAPLQPIVEITQEVEKSVTVEEDVIVVAVEDETTAVVEVTGDRGAQGPPGPEGPQGDQGVQGPPGAIGADKNYRHQQFEPSDTWLIVHNLGKRPIPQVFSSGGDELEGVTSHIDDNSLTVSFTLEYGGVAYLN